MSAGQSNTKAEGALNRTSASEGFPSAETHLLCERREEEGREGLETVRSAKVTASQVEVLEKRGA